MSSQFAITTTASSVSLDASRRGEVAFTVANISGAPVRGQSRLVAQQAASEQWLSLSGGAERNFPATGAEQYSVKIAVPANAPAGSYQFHLDMVDVARPDENYVTGPTVTIAVPAAAQVKKPFPWWIVAVAAAVLIVGGIIAIIFWPRAILVPDGLVGMAYNDAAARLEDAQLTAERIDAWNAMPEGQVFQTDPAEGEPAGEPGATVQLYVSKGPEAVGELDLAVRAIRFEPTPPVQGQPVSVYVTVENVGTADAGAFELVWWPGENYPDPLRQSVSRLRTGEERTLTFAYAGYPSWYSQLTTRVAIDPDNTLGESSRSNNELRQVISVEKAPLVIVPITPIIVTILPVGADLELMEIFLSTGNEVILRVNNSEGSVTAPTFTYQLFQDGALVRTGQFDTPERGSMAFWTGYILSGEHSIRAIIDPDNAIAEGDKANNTVTASLTGR